MDKSEVRSLCRGWSVKGEKCQGPELTLADRYMHVVLSLACFTQTSNFQTQS